MEVRGVDRYVLDKLPELQRNLEEQIAGTAKYSLDVAVAVLRLYQLNPSLANKSLIARTLAKALMQLPRPDYRICIHLLPEKLVAEEPVSSVVLLAQHLESSNLRDFWAASNAAKDTISSVPGFQDAIRAYVLHTIGITFQKVHTRVLTDWLRLDSAGLQQLLLEKTKLSGWKVQGDVVQLPLNAFNQAVQAKRSHDLVSFESVAPVLRFAISTP